MRYYFAPMEGLTDSIYRSAHHRHFGGPDRYYLPFLSPTVHRSLTPREARELPMADTLRYTAIPQLLTKVPEDFLWMAQVCRDRGYPEVNLNLGCPSGTVVAKGKGSGMLRDPEALDAFLEAVFQDASLPISVKTRLGMEAPEEFPRLLEIYNRYPIAELTIHPRVRRQFYDGSVDMAVFTQAAERSASPLCYNGDILNLHQAQKIRDAYPNVQAVMIGRGLLADPGMLSGGTKKEQLEPFLAELMERYCAEFGGSRNAMFRMKEHWGFLHTRFSGSDKLWKRLRKTTDLQEFRAITREFFASCPLVQ